MARASIGAVPPSPKLGTETLTYGVELEFVFAFHEDELAPFLEVKQGVRSTIRKEIPLKDRIWNKQKLKTPHEFQFTKVSDEEHPDHPYNSWGVVKGQTKWVWPYIIEPQQILRRKLEAELPEWEKFSVRKFMKASEKTEDQYTRWIVTADHSVCGVGSANIPKWLPKVSSKDKWDSYGLEIVSPVFKTDSKTGKNQIKEILRAVTRSSTDKTGVFITNQCGLHVHVQCPDGLAFLRELAVLILVYEEELARLNPPCRRPMHQVAKNNIESNRLGSQLEFKEGDWRPRGKYQTIDCSTKEFKKECSIAHIRQRVAAKLDEDELVEFLNWPSSRVGRYQDGNRNRLVNFTTAIRDQEFPKTIEFRSARGTLSGEDVSRWVDVCVGLVRLATFYLKNPDRFPAKKWEKQAFVDGKIQRNDVNVFRLLNDMGLDEEGIRYWEGRVARWMTGTPGDADDRSDNEVLNGQLVPSGLTPPPPHPSSPSPPPPSGLPPTGQPSGKRRRSDVGDDDEEPEGKGPGWERPKIGISDSFRTTGGRSDFPDFDPEDLAAGVGALGCDDLGLGTDFDDTGLDNDSLFGESGGQDTDDDEECGENVETQGTCSKPDSSKNTSPGTAPKTAQKPCISPPSLTGGTSLKSSSSGKTTMKNATATNQKSPPPTGRKGSKPTFPNKPLAKDLQDQDRDTVMGRTSSQTADPPKIPPGRQNTAGKTEISPGTKEKIGGILQGLESSMAIYNIQRQNAINLGDAPVGILSPNEAMFRDDFGWRVRGFDLSEWMIERTRAGILVTNEVGLPRYRRNICGVIALIQSMRAQYPEFPEMGIPQLLQMGDNITRALPGGRDLRDAHDDVIDELLHNWTNGRYILVIVNERGEARRVGRDERQASFGRNLFVRHHPARAGRGLLDYTSGHYESLRRKTDEEIENERVVKERQGLLEFKGKDKEGI